MAKIILKIFGAFFIAFGLIGLFIEAPALFSGKEAGAFGLALALIILFFGTMTLIISSRSRNSAKSPGKNTKAHRAPGSYVNTLSILGMIFSGLNIAAGAGIVLFGGVFLSLLFSEKSESGWGLLGTGMSIIGFLLLIFGIIKLIGYLKLKKHKYSGFIIVLVIEIFSVLFLGFTLAAGFWILTALPLAWSVFIVVYLFTHKNEFKTP